MGRPNQIFTAETWIREGHAEPVQSSVDRRWPGLVLYRFRDARVELPEAACTYHEINYVASGQADIRLTACGRAVEGSWGAGSIGIEPAGMPMSWRGHQDDVINLFLDPLVVADVAAELWDADDVALCDGLRGGRDPEIGDVALALSSLLDDPPAESRLNVESLVARLALALLRGYAVRAMKPLRTKALDARRLQRARRYVEDHLAEDFGLDAFAAAVGLTPVYFARAFKRSTGMTPFQYRQVRRVERAKRLLAGGTSPISEVAAAVGCADQAHLTRLFARLTGTTPARYRRGR